MGQQSDGDRVIDYLEQRRLRQRRLNGYGCLTVIAVFILAAVGIALGLPFLPVAVVAVAAFVVVPLVIGGLIDRPKR